MPPITVNRKARYDYFLFDKFEAGICLTGNEVKSIREGKINLNDSFVRIDREEAFLYHCHISPYSRIQGHVDIDPTRYRKLLLKHQEIHRLLTNSRQKGYAIIPLSVYFKRGLVKIEIALGKGKKQYDKRDTIKKRIHDRESSSATKSYVRKGQ